MFDVRGSRFEVTFGNFLALGALLVREIDVKRIGIWKIIEFHGLNLQSRNVLCQFMESVMTRKKRRPNWTSKN